MLVLALDTSSAAVSAALVDVNAGSAEAAEPIIETAVDLIAGHTTINARGHGEFLAPMIAACLTDAGVRAAELAAVVVGTGPGPFTGLRVGLVTAAVLADTLGIPAYGVCSLDGIAYGRPGTVLVAGDARRKEVYWACYRDGVRTSGPSVSRPADVALDGLSVMAGAGARLHTDVLGLPLLDADYPVPADLVRRAAARIVGRAPADPLTPLYLRRPDAVVPGLAKAVSR